MAFFPNHTTHTFSQRSNTAMKEFILHIKFENDAFQATDEHEAFNGNEVGRLLDIASYDVKRGSEAGNLYDINGNRCGDWLVEDDGESADADTPIERDTFDDGFSEDAYNDREQRRAETQNERDMLDHDEPRAMSPDAWSGIVDAVGLNECHDACESPNVVRDPAALRDVIVCRSGTDGGCALCHRSIRVGDLAFYLSDMEIDARFCTLDCAERVNDVARRYRRVVLTQDVERYPFFIAPAGTTGYIVEAMFANGTGATVHLDEIVDGAEDWDNEIVFIYNLDEFDSFVSCVAPLSDDTRVVVHPQEGGIVRTITETLTSEKRIAMRRAAMSFDDGMYAATKGEMPTWIESYCAHRGHAHEMTDDEVLAARVALSMTQHKTQGIRPTYRHDF